MKNSTFFLCSLPPVTTQCVVSELEGLGQQLSGAMYVAKRFQLRNCGHHRDTQPAADCVRSMTSELTLLVVYIHLEAVAVDVLCVCVCACVCR